MQGGGGERGEKNWDNYNNIINKIYLQKQVLIKSVYSFNAHFIIQPPNIYTGTFLSRAASL